MELSQESPNDMLNRVPGNAPMAGLTSLTAVDSPSDGRVGFEHLPQPSRLGEASGANFYP